VWKYISLILLCLGACSLPPGNMIPESAAKPQSLLIEGRASYYGGWHNGRITSNGTIFDSSSMTAAHRTLPFGTQVTVTNLTNSHSCDVEITDRGPANWTGRVIDVSKGAARCLDMIIADVVPVTLQYTR
jgi:rare lipoprotein A